MKSLPKLLSVVFAGLMLGSVSLFAAPRSPRENTEQALQALLNDVLSTNNADPGVTLYVDCPRIKLSWAGAAGVVDRVRKVPLKPDNPVRIASNTKTFVSVAILRLWEQDLLSLDSTIAEHLPKPFLETIRRGGYDPASISVRHLLTHTSGLFDFSQSEQFEKLCNANPMRHWTRIEQLRGAMEWGHPYGAPGEVFSYSDTGYILLGEILEQKTGKSMGAALRELVGYKALGLNSTWLETAEPEPPGVLERAHQYDGERDTYQDDPSSDLYGGGGLVSTVHDLGVFMQGVFTGRVYAKPSTIEMMLATVPAKKVGPPAYGVPQVSGVYRMGVRVTDVNGVAAYTHSGYWGTLAAYVPTLDLAIGASIGQTKERHQQLSALLAGVVHVVKTVEDHK